MPSTYICTDSSYGYHPGEWFEILGTVTIKNRLCFVVDIGEEEDEVIDYWVVADPDGKYRFRLLEY